MVTAKKTILMLAAALFVLPVTAMAQGKGGDKPTGTTTVPVGGEMSLDGLAKKYGAFAGSAENAQSLVNGLRAGTEVVLTRTVQGPPPPPPPPPAPQTCTRTVMVPCQVQAFLPGPIPGTSIPVMQDSTCPSTQTYDCTPPAAASTPPAPTVEREAFTPPTGNMGLGNVDIALAFAQAQLLEVGIKTPSPAELKAALMGGQVTGPSNSRNLPGILTLRAGGMGWGQIANQLGYKLQ